MARARDKCQFLSVTSYSMYCLFTLFILHVKFLFLSFAFSWRLNLTCPLVSMPTPPRVAHQDLFSCTRISSLELPHLFTGATVTCYDKKSYDKPRQCIKKQRHHFANKGLYSQSYGFSSSHVWMLELDLKGEWALENWCFQIMVLDKTFESPLDSSKIKPVNPKVSQL